MSLIRRAKTELKLDRDGLREKEKDRQKERRSTVGSIKGLIKEEKSKPERRTPFTDGKMKNNRLCCSTGNLKMEIDVKTPRVTVKHATSKNQISEEEDRELALKVEEIMASIFEDDSIQDKQISQRWGLQVSNGNRNKDVTMQSIPLEKRKKRGRIVSDSSKVKRETNKTKAHKLKGGQTEEGKNISWLDLAKSDMSTTIDSLVCELFESFDQIETITARIKVNQVVIPICGVQDNLNKQVSSIHLEENEAKKKEKKEKEKQRAREIYGKLLESLNEISPIRVKKKEEHVEEDANERFPRRHKSNKDKVLVRQREPCQRGERLQQLEALRTEELRPRKRSAPPAVQRSRDDDDEEGIQGRNGSSAALQRSKTTMPTGKISDDFELDNKFMESINPTLRSLPLHILKAIKLQSQERHTSRKHSDVEEGSEELIREGRKRGNTAIALVPYMAPKDEFYSYPVPIRKVKSEPFLSSWDYSAQQIYQTKSSKSTLVSSPMDNLMYSSRSLSFSSASSSPCPSPSPKASLHPLSRSTSFSASDCSQTDFTSALSISDSDQSSRTCSFGSEGETTEGDAEADGAYESEEREEEARGRRTSMIALDMPERRKPRSKFGNKSRKAMEYDDQEIRNIETFESMLQEMSLKAEREVTYRMKEDNIKYVICGCLEGLFAVLFYDAEDIDKSYVDTFLATHCCYTDSMVLFTRLKDMYIGVSSESKFFKQKYNKVHSQLLSVRVRVVHIIKRWIDLFYTDFQNQPGLLKELEAFESMMPLFGGKYQHWQSVLRTAKAKAQMRFEKNFKRTATPGEVPTPLVPRQLKCPSFLDFHPLEVARQLTLLDWKLFAAIEHREWLGTVSTPQQHCGSILSGAVAVSNTQRWINFSQQGCSWVATEIIMTPNPKQCSSVIQRFIEIADYCFVMNNFNGLIQIYNALTLPAISRLFSAWKCVSERHLNKLKDIQNLVDVKNNYGNLRQTISHANCPKIPCCELFLKEFSQQETIPYFVNSSSGLINFEKMTSLAKLLLELSQQQSLGYHLEEVEPISNYLAKPPLVLSEKELMNNSRTFEASQESPIRGRRGMFMSSLSENDLSSNVEDIKKRASPIKKKAVSLSFNALRKLTTAK